MIIKSDIELRGGDYYVTVALDVTSDRALTGREKDAIAMFGEPTIACGGEFTTEGLTFTLPANSLRFPSQFPLRSRFSGDDAAASATLFRTTMIQRIQTGMAAQVAQVPGTTGRWVETVSTDA